MKNDMNENSGMDKPNDNNTIKISHEELLEALRIVMAKKIGEKYSEPERRTPCSYIEICVPTLVYGLISIIKR
jgi:hypothetical protein